jgi:hypothetical protein
VLILSALSVTIRIHWGNQTTFVILTLLYVSEVAWRIFEIRPEAACNCLASDDLPPCIDRDYQDKNSRLEHDELGNINPCKLTESYSACLQTRHLIDGKLLSTPQTQTCIYPTQDSEKRKASVDQNSFRNSPSGTSLRLVETCELPLFWKRNVDT